MKNASKSDIAIQSSLRGDWSLLAASGAGGSWASIPAPDLNNRGVAFFSLGRPRRAAALFRAAVRAEPHNAQFVRHFGLALLRMAKVPEAVSVLREAVRLDPVEPAHRRSLAAALLRHGSVIEALENAEAALAGEPKNADSWELVGECLAKTGRIVQSATAYSRAVSLDNRRVSSWNNLGGSNALCGNIAKSIKCFRRAEDLSRSPAVGSNLLLTLHYAEKKPEIIFREHVAWAARHFGKCRPAVEHRKNGRATGRLRIGYVSPDFRQHSVALLIEPVLSAHDRKKVDVFLYPTTDRSDHVTDRLRSHCSAWHPLHALSDDAAANLILSHHVDILVDLAGHTSRNRLGIFARKPAPVQVTYCGYPNTTGLKAIDYRLTDEYCDPTGVTEHLHTERLWRLPSGFITYRAPENVPEVSPLPAECRRYVTFGCFGIRQKITAGMLQLWAGLLRRVPNSRLIIKNGQVSDWNIAEALRLPFRRMGLPDERVELRGMNPGREHLEQYSDVDIMLDTFPYNATIGTCEALWMGVPVLSLAGQVHVSRVCVSLLNRVGLPDWVATSKQEYLDKAVSFAADTQRLATIRNVLRERFRQSSLGDSAVITRELEQAYRAMWSSWCTGHQI